MSENEMRTTNVANEEEIQTEPKDSLQFLTHVKGNLKRHFKLNAEEEQQRCDLDCLIREIRVLLTVNDEILNEMIPRFTKNNGLLCKEDKVVVKRIGFNKINTSQFLNTIQLISSVTIDEETFDVLPLTQLPTCLGNTVVAMKKAEPFPHFVDYDDYFRKALMLFSEDSLGLLLPMLRVHLEDVELCLGKIHEWAMQQRTICR